MTVVKDFHVNCKHDSCEKLSQDTMNKDESCEKLSQDAENNKRTNKKSFTKRKK